MLVGHARVSTHDHSLALQIDALKNSGCRKIFDDKISGVGSEQPGLTAALDYARRRDSLLVWRLGPSPSPDTRSSRHPLSSGASHVLRISALRGCPTAPRAG
ncbi:MAG: recombinase family protein [Anaerolineae bacterium]|nr:recombinase family protein [Anaerolineae bacterium]